MLEILLLYRMGRKDQIRNRNVFKTQKSMCEENW
jgi:hypothetical protein